MKFYTQSGSVYELDRKHGRIRRINGNNPPRKRQGKDGEWQTYADVSDVTIGLPVIIAWDVAIVPLLPGSPKGSLPSTITSNVVKIEED